MSTLYDGIYTITNPGAKEDGDLGSFQWSCTLCQKGFGRDMNKARECCKVKTMIPLNKHLPEYLIDVIWKYTAFAEAWYKEVHDIYG